MANKFSDARLVDSILKAREEADEARQSRLGTNNGNQQTYYGLQDWGDKIAGQSREVLPKLFNAVERFCGTLERALVSNPNFYRVEYNPKLEGPTDAMMAAAALIQASGATVEPQPEEFLTETAAKCQYRMNSP